MRDNRITDSKSKAHQESASSFDPFKIAAQIKSRGPAPVHLWNPPFCGDIDMRIARDGTWFHEGKPIRRPAMVQLFASILMRGQAEGKGEQGKVGKEAGDEYFLVTPVEKVRIRVEDCPFVVNQMDVRGSGKKQQILFTTNTGETLTADQQHPIEVSSSETTNEPHPIVHVRNGLNALINRAVFYRLVELGEERKSEGRNELGVWSAGEFFSLGSAD